MNIVTRRFTALSAILAMTLLGGCSQTIDLYHDVEGGAIAKSRQPPPGANLPYPNLADVPAVPKQGNANESEKPNALAASSQALAGLALPETPPPVPTIPGVTLPSGMATTVSPPPPKQVPGRVEPVVRRFEPPVSIEFRPGSALLPYRQQVLVERLAAKRGTADVRVCGFGGGSLMLALVRARRLADALTAAGVPEHNINITAFAQGSGGFVQLVY